MHSYYPLKKEVTDPALYSCIIFDFFYDRYAGVEPKNEAKNKNR